MRFNPNLLELIPTSQLDADFGGQNHYEFEPRSYWDQIVAYVPFHTFTSLFRSSIQNMQLTSYSFPLLPRLLYLQYHPSFSISMQKNLGPSSYSSMRFIHSVKSDAILPPCVQIHAILLCNTQRVWYQRRRQPGGLPSSSRQCGC